MRLKKLFVITVLAGAMSVLGCGDDATGTGNTNGGGGGVCDDCENQSDIPLCEAAYDQCKDLPNQDECVLASLALCSVL